MTYERRILYFFFPVPRNIIYVIILKRTHGAQTRRRRRPRSMWPGSAITTGRRRLI